MHPCTVEGAHADCHHVSFVTRMLWQKLQASMEEVLSKTTLAWLKDEAKKILATAAIQR